MIKPERLKRGDKVAIVSLSRGMLGEDKFIHKYYLAKQRLENDYGLEVVAMPNALKGIDYLYRHPEARAQDPTSTSKCCGITRKSSPDFLTLPPTTL